LCAPTVRPKAARGVNGGIRDVDARAQVLALRLVTSPVASGACSQVQHSSTCGWFVRRVACCVLRVRREPACLHALRRGTYVGLRRRLTRGCASAASAAA
jgi:hypothetical protein